MDHLSSRGKHDPSIWVFSPDPETRRLIRMNLNYRKVQSIAPTQPAAWIELEPNPYLIILEFDHPNIDAWEIAQALRQRSLTQQVPLVLLTAVTPRLSQLFELEPVRWISKPLAMGDLLVVVREVLSWHEASWRLSQQATPPAPFA